VVGAGPIRSPPRASGRRTDSAATRPLATHRVPRWGDYGAAATTGDSIWIASEYVAQPALRAVRAAPFGSCAGTRHRWATGHPHLESDALGPHLRGPPERPPSSAAVAVLLRAYALQRRPDVAPGAPMRTSCDSCRAVAAPGATVAPSSLISARPVPRCPCRRRPTPRHSRTKAGRQRVADHHAASEIGARTRRSDVSTLDDPAVKRERQVARAAECSSVPADAGAACGLVRAAGVPWPPGGVARCDAVGSRRMAMLASCAGRPRFCGWPACVRSRQLCARGAWQRAAGCRARCVTVWRAFACCCRCH